MGKKKSIIIIVLAIIGCFVLICFVGISYVLTFNGGISNDHQRWAEFGSIFGAITGLLAFLGVLWTVLNTNKNHENAEERSNFFSFMGFFKETKNNLTVCHFMMPKNFVRGLEHNFEPKKGQEVFDEISDYAIMCLGEQFYKSIPENLNVDDVFNSFDYEIDEKVKNDLKDKFNQINEERNSGNSVHRGIIHNKEAQRLNYNSLKLLFDYYIANNLYFPIADSFRNTGNFMGEIFRNYLGDYCRNVYYILESFDNYEKSSIYPKLFRSQLSQEELILILFNSFSHNATKDTRKKIIKYDLFNNLRFYQLGLVIEEKTKENIIGNLYNSL